MKVIMLTRKHCNQCEMMKQVLKDRVEYADVLDRPDLIGLTRYTSLPVFLVFNEELCIGSFYGLMSLERFEEKMRMYA